MFALLRVVLILVAVVPAVQGQLVIAHRGASGYLPEHTLEAYTLAYGQGAHYIESDVVMTKDRVFICLHDLHLEATTNVGQVFPERKREEDGRWYAADFTLEEIKSLRANDRLPDRFSKGEVEFKIPTFREMIELVQRLNKTTGRNVGIYPELKSPSFHSKQGLPMEEAFLRLIREYGYRGKNARIFVQCFDPKALQKLRALGSQLRQILLIGNGLEGQELLASPSRAEDIVGFADGIGPAKELLERMDGPFIVEALHAHGLLVHPYTFRMDEVPAKYAGHEAELEAFFREYGVDGIFTDFPDRAVKWLHDNDAD